jgi:hypothetical protein
VAAFNVTAGNSVYSSLNGVLLDMSTAMLTQCPGGLAGSYRIPETVTSIVEGAFQYSYNLTSVTIPKSVISIGQNAFAYYFSLTTAYFQGNAPPDNPYIFYVSPTISYYLPETTGWDATFGGNQEAFWNRTCKP